MALLSKIFTTKDGDFLWLKTKRAPVGQASRLSTDDNENVGVGFIQPERSLPLNTLKDILEKIDLEEGYKSLTKREMKIITLYYLEGYKDEEIAKIYGLSQQAINYVKKKGINKLKSLLSFPRKWESRK